MSVLIKDMEMPKNCFECPFGLFHFKALSMFKCAEGDFSCVITHKALTSTKRNRFCPLIEAKEEEDETD